MTPLPRPPGAGRVDGLSRTLSGLYACRLFAPGHRPDSMPSAALLPTLLALAALTSAAQAAPPPEPFSFSHKDWVVQCDNTLTCRAAGYQAEGEASQPISLLLVRKPGPATPVEVHLQAYDDEEPQGPFSLQLGRVRVSVPTLERTRLPDAQAEAVLRALDSAKAGVLTGAGRRWTL